MKTEWVYNNIIIQKTQELKARSWCLEKRAFDRPGWPVFHSRFLLATFTRCRGTATGGGVDLCGRAKADDAPDTEIQKTILLPLFSYSQQFRTIHRPYSGTFHT